MKNVKIRILVIVASLLSILTLGMVFRKEKISGLNKIRINDEMTVRSYNNDSTLVINQGRFDFIMFLTYSVDSGVRHCKIDIEGIESISNLKITKDNKNNILEINYLKD